MLIICVTLAIIVNELIRRIVQSFEFGGVQELLKSSLRFFALFVTCLIDQLLNALHQLMMHVKMKTTPTRKSSILTHENEEQ